MRVLERSEDGRWLRVKADDGTEGWVTRRYVGEGGTDGAPSSSAPAGSSAVAQVPGVSIWTSRDACAAERAAGRRLPRAAQIARLGTWNVRWFPDGAPGAAAPGAGTDLEWLACAIDWLDVDALAVQEWKRVPAAIARLRGLLAARGRRFDVALDDCSGPDRQHVGVMWDTARARAGRPISLSELNPLGGACEGGLRPGLGLPLVFEGGLDLTLVSLHLDSGTDARAHGHRSLLPASLARASLVLARRTRDDDVVFAGDFNTMGCDECAPAVTGAAEVSGLGVALQKASPLLRHVASPAACTWAGGRASVLDHVVVRSLAELPAASTATVAGLCATGCGKTEAPALRALSDHCPVLLDVPARDLD